jgi:hypothetical protein
MINGGLELATARKDGYSLHGPEGFPATRLCSDGASTNSISDLLAGNRCAEISADPHAEDEAAPLAVCNYKRSDNIAWNLNGAPTKQ